MLRFFRSIFTLISLTAATLLLITVASAYISPVKINLLAFAGFLFPFTWLLNVALFFVWIIQKRWQAVIHLVVVLFTIGHWINTFQWSANQPDPKESATHNLSVMSFNVRMFDYYNWSKDKNTSQRIFKFIGEQNPDILCIQEFFSHSNHPVLAEKEIVKQLHQYPYRHIEYGKHRNNGQSFGLATFSKHPIVHKQAIKFDNTTNFSIVTDVTVRQKRIRVFNNHLESIRFTNKHINFIDSLNYKSDKERRAGISEIVHKLNNAFRARATQAEVIAAKITASPHPSIVCGDFNDTPVSYVYRKMRGNLADSFVESGKGFGGTYHGKLPSYRIDFIFHDKRFRSHRFTRFQNNLSDHYPIQCTLNLNTN